MTLVIPILGRNIAQRAGAADASIAEENVDMSKLGHYALYAHADLLILGDVGGDGDDLGGAEILALALDILKPVALDVDEGDTHPLLSRVQSESLADSACRAGNAANFALVIFHISASFRNVSVLCWMCYL